MPETVEADDDLTIQEVLREINLADPIPNTPPPATTAVTQSPPQPAVTTPLPVPTQAPQQPPMMVPPQPSQPFQPPMMASPQPYPAYPPVPDETPIFSGLLKRVLGEVHLSLLIVAIVIILRMGFVQRFLVEGVAARINLPHIHAVSEVVLAVVMFWALKYATS